jgi:TRAP-type transport system small permease protein
MITTSLSWLRRIERGVAMALLMAIFVLVFVATATRYLGSPVIWAIEVTQAMFVWLCVLSADITLQHFGHFSVPALADLLPRPARRVLETFNAVVVLVLLAFLAKWGATFTNMKVLHELPMTRISESFATAALPVGFALMFITVAEQLVRRWTRPDFEDAHATRDVM